MTVIIMARFEGNPEDLERVGREQAETMKRVSEEGRSRGAVHHCFVESDGGFTVVDEWDSAESFQAFFQSNTEIPGIVEAAGAKGPTEVVVLRKLDMPDEF